MTSTTTDRREGVNTSVAIKAPVRSVCTSNISASGLSAISTIDGSLTPADGDRFLLTAQTSNVNNGIYVAASGTWARAKDFDSNREVRKGTLITTQSGVQYRLTTSDPITIGTSNLTFSSNDNTTLATSLASTGVGAGASLVGINDVGSLITATTVEAALQEIAAAGWVGTAGGTATAITLTLNPTLAAYTDGMAVRWRWGSDTSGATTLNIDGLGAKSLVKRDGTAIGAGDGQQNDIATAVYNSTQNRFELQSPDGTLYRDGNNAPARADVASAATVNLDTAGTNYVRITGTTTITAITLTDGRWRDVVFGGALTLTNGASLILPGGANITTAAGDTMRVLGEAAGVVRVTVLIRAAQSLDGPTGSQVGYARTTNATAVSGTTTIPEDNTIPQNTEGTEYTEIATAYTPKYATSLLEIEVTLPVVASTVQTFCGALFVDATADALAAALLRTANAQTHAFVLRTVISAASTSARTYKLRYGPSTAGTTYIGSNGAGTEIYSTAKTAVMTVKEIKQ